HSPDGQLDHGKVIIHSDASARLDCVCLASPDEFPAIDGFGGRESVADALVLEKVFGCHRTAMSRKVIGATDDYPSKIVREADCDHVALNKFSDANTGVELIGCNVDRGIVHVQIDGYLWIGETEGVDDIPKNELESDTRYGKAESTDRPRAQRG